MRGGYKEGRVEKECRVEERSVDEWRYVLSGKLNVTYRLWRSIVVRRVVSRDSGMFMQMYPLETMNNR